MKRIKTDHTQSKNQNAVSRLKILAFLFATLFFLALYSVLYEHLPLLSQNFKQIHILPIQKHVLTRDTEALETTRLLNIQTQLLEWRDIKRKDSLNKAMAAQNAHGLTPFFRALDSVQKNTARIAYYGDSMIEGDLITMTLRQWFQKDFGGRGIGFMPMTSQTSRFRVNIEHVFSENWQTKNLLDVSEWIGPLGISGEVFYGDTTGLETTVSFKSKNYPFVDSFPKATLFYGSPDSLNLANNRLKYNDSQWILNGNQKVNTIDLINTPVTELNLKLQFEKPLPIYGVSFESETGVLLDNFPMRGNTGPPLTFISGPMIKAFNKTLDYDLIVLQFGLNVVSGKTQFIWYKNRMKRVVRHFQRSMPNAAILIVSVPDMSYKNDMGQMETNPSIPYIVEAQRFAALETNVTFFNLYEAMGGENSMVDWVENLRYANKDYTHFNFRGARHVGKILYDFLMRHYEQHKQSEE